MKFNVTIKENETGKICREFDCNAILGGIALDGTECGEFAVVSTDTKGLINACVAAHNTIKKALSDDPIALMLFTMIISDCGKGDIEEENEGETEESDDE